MIKILFVVLSLLLIINLSGCGGRDTFFVINPNENSPEKMFKAIIADPIPEDITNLKGASIYWQGYSVYFCFHATDSFIENLVRNHQRVSFESIRKDIEKSERLEEYLDFWTIDQIKEPECYQSNGSYKNKITHSGSDWIVIDRANKTVYFYGIGS